MTIRQKSLIAGALLGAVLGGVAGWLFSRGYEMPRPEKAGVKHQVPPADIAKLGLSIMTVLRSVAELGERV
jgi:membrane protein YqaA with SNARE-associated domain